jgi:hypothetical protein
MVSRVNSFSPLCNSKFQRLRPHNKWQLTSPCLTLKINRREPSSISRPNTYRAADMQPKFFVVGDPEDQTYCCHSSLNIWTQRCFAVILEPAIFEHLPLIFLPWLKWSDIARFASIPGVQLRLTIQFFASTSTGKGSRPLHPHFQSTRPCRNNRFLDGMKFLLGMRLFPLHSPVLFSLEKRP